MSGRSQYSDRRWRRLRARILRERPFCECGCGKPSTDVHHLDGLGLNGPRGYDPANLQALAHDCHSRITAGEHGWGARPKRTRETPKHPGLIN